MNFSLWRLLFYHVFYRRRPDSESSDNIVFEKDDAAVTSDSNVKSQTDSSKTEKESVKKQDDEADARQVQFMYIQMEFCEKSTLR